MRSCQKYRLFFLLLTLCWPGGTFDCLAQKERPFGFNPIRKRANYTFCSFDLRANLIVVKTRIDNSDTLNFILDSGVQSIIILDTTLRKKIKTNIGREIYISGIGEAPPFTASVSLGHTVKFGDIAGYSQNLVLLQEDFLSLSDYLGIPIHGILGSDVFKRFNVTIDYQKGELTFSDPHKYRYRKRKGVAVPLHLERTKPYIMVNRLESNGEKVENVKLVIDTGGAHSLLLNRESLPPGLVPEKLTDGHLGRGLNGNIEGKLGRIDLLRFGNQDFKNVIVTFPDSLVFDSKITQEYLLRNGSIGGEILKKVCGNAELHPEPDGAETDQKGPE
ncbi:MAG: retropepsin-like domain-containing protein [Leadbetterella sp.]|nr:retropepsin-like domain-containing protein [Leadbetterella sp.]